MSENVNQEQRSKSSVKRAVDDTLGDDKEGSRSSFKKLRPDSHPRWHNQAYMLFLALRQHPDLCMPRGELIKAALELDKKISSEMSLPLVFRGKTPANSASASLTTNTDRYFIPFKPEGSKSTWFKLAYEPGNEEKAVQEYQKWLKKLAEHDWPYCFGVPKVLKEVKKPEDGYQTPPASETDIDTESKKVMVISALDDVSNEIIQTPSPKSIKEKTPEEKSREEESIESIKEEKTEKERARNKKSPSSKSDDSVNHQPEMPTYTLDELDLNDIPNSWKDIVYIAPSNIPGAGSGLFAKRKLPYNTPIGFYFGVPMTEDEFDSLKDRVGRSSEYSIMYRRTVLDATDKDGQPVTDENNPRFCPFHFMNESDEHGASVLFVEGIVVNQVICWTKRDIEAGEELLAWYGKDVNRYWDSERKKTSQDGQEKTRCEIASEETGRSMDGVHTEKINQSIHSNTSDNCSNEKS
ncbi:hypothetical protein G6F46_009398 [Rhizopus delemar]|uniref:SET domain-containing protein n=3 Tax=Rhizopus TaxID=4842 RepID=I1C8A1_RHIO9|nr:hypothetical protein RO3G_09391 [Rhizopus delemar RA 99-880]KAG1456099.1 hypothetical protein G6F55_006693 [Rhizopus delemar]KAG1541946.1 hypothetical protein G6F51_007575 [Rhizopus arrhizus]KAG1495167.1 hypothetical protein G6F54_007361 [Rhizopus delemar]KAG1518477.1 hypothetical protein G6F53_000562 [Rhizopus delemar]|eukprot:EIE84681.1 hypothetical protein RO3G_09391 [Rhizopus delemar RA 99-880]